jgi:hypothetical protein
MVTVTSVLLIAAAFAFGVALIVRGIRGMLRNFNAENPNNPNKGSN